MAMGREIHTNPYHVTMIRSQLTRNIEALYPEIRDEIIASFRDVLDLRQDGKESALQISMV